MGAEGPTPDVNGIVDHRRDLAAKPTVYNRLPWYFY